MSQTRSISSYKMPKMVTSLSHIQPQSSLQASDTETVRIVTIDETISSDRKISVLHLDVEGYEEQVLTGALKTIRRSRPLLVLEDVPSEAWLTKHLKPLDYRIDRRIHHNTLRVPAAIV